MSIHHSKKILLHTGNILDNEELVRKVGQTTLEELRACVKTTLNSWKKNEKNDVEVLEIRNASKAPSPETSQGLKTTVKIFLSSNSGEHVLQAINTVKNELKMNNLHTVIIIPPDVSDDLTLNELKPVWKALEHSVHKGQVTHIGIADLSPQLFKELYEYAAVKPSLIQVNLSSCCTVSEDLTEFARLHDVQVLTHNDDPEVIDEDIIATIMSRVGMTGVQSEVLWLARHRAIQICFGLVIGKGYTLALNIDENN